MSGTSFSYLTFKISLKNHDYHFSLFTDKNVEVMSGLIILLNDRAKKW